MPRTNKKNSRSATQALRLFFICIRKEKPLLKVVPNIDGREGNGSNNIVVFLTIQYYCLSLRHE